MAALCEEAANAHGQEAVGVLHQILSEISEALDARRSFVHAFEPDGRISLAFEWLLPDARTWLSEADLAVGSDARSQLEAGEIAVLPLEAEGQHRLAVLLPLRSHHRTVGVFGLEGPEPGPLSEPSLLPWLRVLAASLASALARRQEESKQAQRHFELRTIDQLHRLLEQCTDVDDLLQRAADMLLDVFGCERAAVFQETSTQVESLRRKASSHRPGHQPFSVVTADVSADRASDLQGVLQTPGVRTFSPAEGQRPLFDEEGTVRSEACVTLRPGRSGGYILVLHQFSFDRVWTVDEKWLLAETGRRLSEGIASLNAFRQLRTSEDRYRQVLAAVPDLILVFDPSGRLEDVFSSSPEQLGMSPSDAVGKPLEYVFSPETAAKLLPVIQGALEGSEVRQVEYPLQTEGRTRWFSAQARAFGVGDRRRVLWVARDVTERRDLQAWLLQAQKLESVGRLAGGVAHDFNNLLTAVLGYVDLIQAEFDPGHPIQDDLGQIREAGRRGTRLAKQLLVFARKDAMVPELVVLDDLVIGMISMLQRLLGEDVVVRTEPGTDGAVILIDPGQMEQLVMNLVVNARDAMPRGGVLTLRTGRVDIGEHKKLPPGPYVKFEVHDTGVGMSREVMAQIFDPFFTTKEPGKGTGLGLATCYGIVRHHHGTIEVESDEGLGSCFRVLLPRSQQPAPATSSDLSDADPRGDETVLLVEDEPNVRKLADRGLRAYGYRVLTAASGEEAIRISARHPGPIHLLVTDLIMPGMRGTQLSGLLLESRSEMRVLYVSGFSEEVATVRMRRHVFVQKPFTPRTLALKAREALDRPTGLHNP